SGSVGVPLVYTNIKIVDTETNEELTYNKDGEICIETPCTMMGYFKNEEETANVLRKHNDGKIWVHTGDIGSVDEDGFIKITGRIKRMIGIYENGIFHKVFPKLLEDEYLKKDSIKAISIVGKPIDETTNTLIAFVVAENGVDKEKLNSELISFTKEKFETYEQPSKFVFVEKLPLTTIGKVDYRALEKEAEKL
ncbi:MAG: acyl--CoA ligase, partial [Ruminococcaceae bacterium]|nr:acyl--CoA ligase [Oscillospiraceae bacterium]